MSEIIRCRDDKKIIDDNIKTGSSVGEIQL